MYDVYPNLPLPEMRTTLLRQHEQNEETVTTSRRGCRLSLACTGIFPMMFASRASGTDELIGAMAATAASEAGWS